MAPVLTIARAEARLHLRRRAFLLLFGLFAVLLAAAAALNQVRQTRERERQTAYQDLVRAQWEGQPDRHPHRVAHYGTFAFKPPGPLSALDPGVDAYAGRIQFLEAHRQNAANFAEASELSSAFRLGELTPAFVLQAVLPLLLVVLGFQTLTAERESGRLRLLASAGLPLRTLALGKALGLAAAAAPFLTLGAAVGLVQLLSDPASPLAQPGGPARAGLFAAAVLAHAIAWVIFTVAVSARLRRSAQAGAVLLVAWLAAVVVLPRAAAALAEQVHPLPDKSSFAAAVTAEVRAQGDSHNPNDEHFRELRERTLARHGVNRVEDLPVNYGAIVMAEGEKLSAETFARHFAALGRTQAAQAAVVDRTAWLAPYLAIRRLSTATAGTDLNAQLAFQRDAEAYRYDFIQQLNALQRDKIVYRGDPDQRLSADHWMHFDDFRAAPPPLADSLRGTATVWLVLLVWIAVPLAFLLRPTPIT